MHYILFTVFACGFVTIVSGVDISDLAPDQILNSLGLGNLRRTVDLGGISGLLSGGFEKLGYVPIDEAISRCEGRARSQVENAINRLRGEGEQIFNELGTDLEARCRSYVEYAGQTCQDRIESLVAKLEVEGREILTREQERCTAETEQVTAQTQKQEEERYRRLGDAEEVRLRSFYENLGKQEEAKIRREFEKRGEEANRTIVAEFTARGERIMEQITREYTARGDLLRAQTEVDTRKRGAEERERQLEIFTKRGEKVQQEEIEKLRERGDQLKIQIEEEFREKGRKLQEEGRKQCTNMISQACEFPELNTESDDFCLDFEFFGNDYDDEEEEEEEDEDEADEDVVDSEAEDAAERFKRFRKKRKILYVDFNKFS